MIYKVKTMKTAPSLFLALCLLLTASCSSLQLPELENQFNSRRALANSIVLVSVENETRSSSATAFAFKNTKNGTELLTNKHVCRFGDDAKYTLTAADGSKYKATFKRYSDSVDVCILSTDAFITRLKLSTYDAHSGDEILTIGAPQGVLAQYNKGFVGGYKFIQLDQEDNSFVIAFIAQFVSCAVYPGSSGSPVFNSYGRVVGIVFAGQRGSDHMSLLVPISLVHQFLLNKENVKD